MPPLDRYLVDLAHWVYQDINDEIGVNSAFVVVFCLWRGLKLEEEDSILELVGLPEEWWTGRYPRR